MRSRSTTLSGWPVIKLTRCFARHPDDTVLGADTVVVVDEHLLEKPVDERDAARMLHLLSGRTHQVITGICLLASGFEQSGAEVTQVRFSPLSEVEIAEYVRTLSRWTKLEPTRFRAWPRAGWSASKAATSMWWDCRCRGCIGCCEPPKRRRKSTAMKSAKDSRYFLSSVGGLVGLGLFAAFWSPIDDLKLRMPSPRPLPSSPSFFGPKISRAMNRMTSSLGQKAFHQT